MSTDNPTPYVALSPLRQPRNAARSGTVVGLLSRVAPRAARPAAPGLLAAGAAAGLLGSVALPVRSPGLGLALTGVVVAAVPLVVVRRRLRPMDVATGVLALALLTTAGFRAAEWLVVLCCLAAAGLLLVALVRPRSWTGLALTAATLPFAAVRMPAWARRGLMQLTHGRGECLWPLLRGAAVAAALVGVFAALFASADAAFAAYLPDFSVDAVPGKALAFAGTAALCLSLVLAAIAPPRWDRLSPGPAAAVRRVEWVLPLALLDAVFLAFAVVQISVFYGGSEHVLKTAGLTHAEYARQGFGQLLVATTLTVGVVALAARRAPRESARDRVVARVLLGVLCSLTLIVVASAMQRLALYEEAFGFTTARLVAMTAELWLGAVVVLVMVAGIRWSGRWLPRAVTLSAGLTLAALAVLNPDALVAERNVERLAATGDIDTWYLSNLSADAVPALDRLPEAYRSCAMPYIATRGDGWAGWNLGRARAEAILEDRARDLCTSQFYAE